MSLDLAERYRYCGPPLREPVSSLGNNEDTKYLRQRMDDVQSLRIFDRNGNFDSEKTYTLILFNAQQLPKKKGYQYALNIANQRSPHLELVPLTQRLFSHHRILGALTNQWENKVNKRRGFRYIDFRREQ